MARCDLSTLLWLNLLWLLLGNALAAEKPISYTPIRVGISLHAMQDTTITDAELGFKMIFDKLGAEIGESVDLKMYKSSADVLRLFKEGKLDFIFLGSLEYLDLLSSMRPSRSYVVQFNEKLKDRFLILVRKDPQTKKLADLRGKRLAIPKGYAVGRQVIKSILLEAGFPVAEQFFSEVHNAEEVNGAIVDLFFGKVDMVLVPEDDFNVVCEMNPQIGAKITALISSPPMLMAAIAVQPNFPLQRINRIEPYLIQETYPPRVRVLMDTFQLTHIRRLDEDMLKEVKALRETLRALEQQPQ